MKFFMLMSCTGHGKVADQFTKTISTFKYPTTASSRAVSDCVSQFSRLPAKCPTATNYWQAATQLAYGSWGLDEKRLVDCSTMQKDQHRGREDEDGATEGCPHAARPAGLRCQAPLVLCGQACSKTWWFGQQRRDRSSLRESAGTKRKMRRAASPGGRAHQTCTASR